MALFTPAHFFLNQIQNKFHSFVGQTWGRGPMALLSRKKGMTSSASMCDKLRWGLDGRHGEEHPMAWTGMKPMDGWGRNQIIPIRLPVVFTYLLSFIFNFSRRNVIVVIFWTQMALVRAASIMIGVRGLDYSVHKFYLFSLCPSFSWR